MDQRLNQFLVEPLGIFKCVSRKGDILIPMIKDFVQFLKEFNVISLAVGFIMGTASTSLIGSLVKDVLMPLVEPLMSVESWKEAVVTIGPVQIGYGSFLAELINFVILALIIFIITKKLLKIERQKTT